MVRDSHPLCPESPHYQASCQAVRWREAKHSTEQMAQHGASDSEGCRTVSHVWGGGSAQPVFVLSLQEQTLVRWELKDLPAE